MRFSIRKKDQEGFPVIFAPKSMKESLCEETGYQFFDGEWLQSAFVPLKGKMTLLVGMGDKQMDSMRIKELSAKALKECNSKKIKIIDMDVSPLTEQKGIHSLQDIVEGAVLGIYRPPVFGKKKEEDREQEEIEVRLSGISEEWNQEAEKLLEESLVLAEAVTFTRDMVNLPGNHLRPKDFVEKIKAQMEGLEVEILSYDAAALETMGMEALLAVGSSSAYPPYLLVLHYHQNPQSQRTIGLIGKGVTCDTGGYCLKAADSMLGIKGDMAGAAAVAATVYALAKNRVKTNVTAVLPLCENRISSGSCLPGDVISSYGGKTIEIGNTDAEGRLILADAVSYAIKDGHATEIVDIATLTGAVAGMLGFSIAGVICDEEGWYDSFTRAAQVSGERYLRIPFYDEHEQMLKSDLADLRNISKSGCGTITAGLFIREFAGGNPWLHLDIAGTAWVDTPVFAFQTKGGTGAGVTTLYHLCTQEK